MKQVTFIWNNKDLQLPDELVGELIRRFGHNSVDIIEEDKKDDGYMLVRIMQSMITKYGIGNILEYVTFFLDRMGKEWTKQASAEAINPIPTIIGKDYQTASEYIQKAIYAIPEAER